MSSSLYWQREGAGEDLVLVHGWGMNGAVWQQTVDVLSSCFQVHVVDLPGYGYSAGCHAGSLQEIVEQLLAEAPEQAIWVGWSLGGLIATHIALNYPQRIKKLVTVASSPKFSAEKPWRGIQPKVLAAFTDLLSQDFAVTVERFMVLQAMGSPTAKQDIKALKQAVLSRPEPNPGALQLGLGLLADIDLRSQLKGICQPFLRLYGRLDGLVPVSVAEDVTVLHPDSKPFTFAKSSHAPFMTELDEFCAQLLLFSGK
ncbi:pimeloyl-[acyl-carrier protein] methyl ester esterase [Vibrio sp. HA2012]|uniref:pimeloyl-ACP methyl ester esterase BioH n=1 Tax=Vibrio sp. HA2012 TaxID=1971595 RepID=UPI000C2C0EEB|nr:pimeloyl-ACP methyl ester esterase BioH [Vibrio sp. HA2012]PJC85192.1 pimeloyl-[acyl-carrier protein] methyl ester esterase [Vibrio sp. HA2012]